MRSRGTWLPLLPIAAAAVGGGFFVWHRRLRLRAHVGAFVEDQLETAEVAGARVVLATSLSALDVSGP